MHRSATRGTAPEHPAAATATAPTPEPQPIELIPGATDPAPLIFDLLPAEPPAVAVPIAAPVGAGRTCRSCGKTYPPSAVLCVACGINLKTGRPVLMKGDDGDLDAAYDRTRRIIRLVSWIDWLGMYPVASEAFGLRKPWVVRGAAALTIVVSLWFLVALIGDSNNPSADHLNMMLWVGRSAPVTPDPRAAEPADGSADTSDAPAQSQSARNAAAHEPGGQPTTQSPPKRDPAEFTAAEDSEPAILKDPARFGVGFHWYQVFTYALLHAGPLHLAGNLLFLFVLGSRVNALIGNLLTLIVYPLLAALAGVVYMIAQSGDHLHAMLGASGVVVGLSGMYLVLFPVHKVHMVGWIRFFVLFGLKMFTVPGFCVPLFYIAFDVISILTGMESDVAHWAHLGGFISGVVIALILLCTRLVNARGGDLLTAVLGRYAWAMIGKPDRPARTLW